MATLLIIDDDHTARRTLELAFKAYGHRVLQSGTLKEGFDLWKEERPDVVLLDLMLPDGDGLDLLSRVKKTDLPGEVLMITGHQDMDKAITAMRTGAFDYIHKPLNIDELELAVERALKMIEQQTRLALVANLASERSEEKIVGQSQAILQVHKQIGLASRGQSNVLITGESGTGKELAARAIHRFSAPNQPFIPVNCSAYVPTLLESEIFGHEKGAFTGAIKSKPGRFELAAKGTVFLDEIGDLDISLQVKLLRVLQERVFDRVGGNHAIPIEARVIAATHRNLETMVQQGLFREDLYYRLKVIDIHLPPLRERKEDIEPLVEHLLVRINKKLRRDVSQVPQEVMDALKAYDWRGNVRELENRLTAGVMLSTSHLLQVELPVETPFISQPFISSSLPQIPAEGDQNDWKKSLVELEKEHIARVLTACRYNLGKTCEILGITRPTLRRKMQEYSL